MLQHTGRAHTQEYGVSEVIGAVMLIAVVGAAVAIIGVALLSQPAPEKIPALEAVISNTGNAIQIYHNGGDTLQKADFKVLVNGAEVPESVLWPGSDTTWSSGETLTFVSPNAKTVQIVYAKGSSAAAVLSSADFGGVSNSSTSLTITAAAGTGGTITPSGAVSVVYGGSQVFAIEADPGYRIVDVLVDGDSVGAVTSYTFSGVTSSHSIYATFAKNPVITTSAGTGGTIAPSGEVSVDYGGSQVFTIIPDTGYHVDDVLVDAESQGAITSYNFTNVMEDHTIAATFTINIYNINATSGPHGSISPGNVTINAGGNQEYIITPDANYRVADVLVDSVSVGALSDYTFTNVQANHTIAATFAINTYNINATAGLYGSISPGNTTVNYGGYQLFTITPSTGYHIADVLVDSISQGTITSYNFTNVVANHTISATFAINQYTINATAGPNGVIDPSGETLVNYGGSQAFTITPNTGYHITDVQVDNVSNGTITSYEFTNVVANHTIAATFLADPPVANFTATPLTGGVPLNVQFTDMSTNNPTSWIWNFGDTMNTTVSYAQHPNHTYEYPGNYSVKLWAANEGGTGYIEKQGYIFTYYPAVANFTGTPTSGSYGLSGMTVQFTDQSTGGISYYNWTFGDGKTKTASNYQQNPGHTYDAVGLYSVNLTVYNAFESAYLLRPDYINVTPNAPTSYFETYNNEVDMITLDNGTAPLSVFFYEYSTDEPTSWVWNFGDGNITTMTKDEAHPFADIYHTFTGAGRYNISLTAINAWGSHTSYREITVFPAPTVTSVSPASGTTAGSTTVTILGTNLVGASAASFGGTAATSVSVINATAVSAITPAHAAGAVNVIVTTPNGTATGTNAYTYLIPITASTGANGAVTPAGVTLYASGATPTYTISPNTGYHVADVLVDGSSVGAVTSYTFPSLTTSHTISATFAINQYTITASSGANGAITPTGVTTLNYGDSQAYTITPNIGYHVADVLVDGSSVGAVTSYTFPSLTTSHTISATFDQNPRQIIYFETFDSTNPAWPYTGDRTWTRSSANVIQSATIKNGTYSIRSRQKTYMTKTISTAGYSDTIVEYKWAQNPISAAEYSAAQYTIDGATYTEFQRITGPLTTLTPVTYSTLPATVDHNSAFGLRFRIYASATSEYLYVDDVKVTGIPDYI